MLPTEVLKLKSTPCPGKLLSRTASLHGKKKATPPTNLPGGSVGFTICFLAEIHRFFCMKLKNSFAKEKSKLFHIIFKKPLNPMTPPESFRRIPKIMKKVNFFTFSKKKNKVSYSCLRIRR